MNGHYALSADLTADDCQLLDRVAGHLNLLADISYADLLLYTRHEHEAVVVAESQPASVPSLYAASNLGKVVTPGEEPLVHRVLRGGRHAVRPLLRRGAPILQEVFPVVAPDGRVIAALASEMSVQDHDRGRRRNIVFRRAVTRLRELVVGGQLRGGERLSRMGQHDGILVVEANGEISYVSAVAEHLYRRLGYADSLLHAQLSELDTNEYICFKAMEHGICLEQRVQERDLIWIKKAIPLLPRPAKGWWSRLRPGASHEAGAIIVIQDVTDEVRKEQELKIKSAMIREIHHRVKNNLHTLAGLLRLQARRSESPEVKEILSQSVNRIQSIAAVHEFLSHDESSIINIHEVSSRILNEVAQGILDPSKRIRFKLEGSSFLLPAQQATSCVLIINELLLNAVEHAFDGRDEGTIVVRLRETPDSMIVEIHDDGRGLPPGFDPMKDGSLGMQIVQLLAKEDLKGHFELRNGGGLTAVVSFPRPAALAEEHR